MFSRKKKIKKVEATVEIHIHSWRKCIWSWHFAKNYMLLFEHYNSIQKGSVSVAVHALGYTAETRRWLTLEINDWKLLWDSMNRTLPSSRYGAVSASLKASILQRGKETGLLCRKRVKKGSRCSLSAPCLLSFKSGHNKWHFKYL